jgi:hypothetical protein
MMDWQSLDLSTEVAMKTALVVLGITAVVVAGWGQPPDTLWTRVFYEPSNTRFNSVCALPNGDCAAIGHCCVNLFHSFYASVYAARVDVQGTTLWAYSYWLVWGNFQAPYAEGFTIQTASTGGLIVGTGANGWPPFGARLLRLNDDGETQWFTYCDPGFTDPFLEITSVCNAASGGFAVTTHSDYDTTRIARIDSSGQLLWRKGIANTTLDCVLPLSDDGFMLAGGPGFLLARLDSTGDTVWTRHLGNDSASFCKHLISRPQGGYLMLGGSGIGVGMVMVVSNEGELLETHTYDYSSVFIAGVACAQGGFLMLSDGLIRVSETLDTLWTQTLPCTDCYGTSVAQTTDSGFVVAGSYRGSSGYLMKFAREGLPTDNRGALHPSSFNFSSFPNPFNPTTTLSFTLPKAGKSKLAVYDLLGREVAMLEDQKYDAGEHRIRFDGSALPSGIYFARMVSGEYVATQKLLLLK